MTDLFAAPPAAPLAAPPAARPAPVAPGPAGPDRAEADPPITYAIIHLTPCAPRCGHTLPSDPNRTRTFHFATGRQIVQSLLRRLDRAPAEVRAAVHENGDVEARAVAEPWAGLPLAIVWEGLDAPRINRLLAALDQAGWRPPAPRHLAAEQAGAHPEAQA